MKNKKEKIYIISICIIGFIALLFKDNIIAIDKIVYNYISNNLMDEFMISLMKFITFFGSLEFFIVASLLMIFLIKNKYNKYIISSVIGSGIIVQIIKFVVGRARPVVSVVPQSGYSFPSGHSVMAVVFFGLIIYYINKEKCSKMTKLIFSIILSLLILLIIFSRLYLSVHYLSDVIAGFIIGLLYIMIFMYLMKKEQITKK